jgi:ATP-dependent Clp protease adaptor protein ClpS
MPSLPWSDPAADDELGAATARRVERPRRYKVLIHNDDFTTMEFVTDVLIRHFGMLHAQATQVMMHVHQRGFGVAGIYPRDLAETKVAEVMAEAQLAGMPLLLTTEPTDASEGEGG